MTKLRLDRATALILTMDDPNQVVRITQAMRAAYPDLTIVARARLTLPTSGVLLFVSETLSADPSKWAALPLNPLLEATLPV